MRKQFVFITLLICTVSALSCLCVFGNESYNLVGEIYDFGPGAGEKVPDGKCPMSHLDWSRQSVPDNASVSAFDAFHFERDWTYDPYSPNYNRQYKEDDDHRLQWYAKYEGNVSAPKSGLYRFTVDADDWVRVYIDNNVVVDYLLKPSYISEVAFEPCSSNEKQNDVWLSAGLHQLKVLYFEGYGWAGDETWTEANFIVDASLRENTRIVCDVASIECSDPGAVCVYLKDEANNGIGSAIVSLKIIDGSDTVVSSDVTTTPNGQACLQWIPSHAGTFLVQAEFRGDESRRLSPTSAECQFNVGHDSSVLTIYNETAKCSDPFQLSVLLTDEENNPLSSRQVVLTVGGKNYTVTTGSDGKAKTDNIYDCLKVGTHPITASWLGDDCYNPSNGNGTVTVNCDPTTLTDETKQRVVQYSDPITLAARIKDDEGLELSGKWISFTMGNQGAYSFSNGAGPLGCQPDNDLTGRNGLASVDIICSQPATKPECTPITTSAEFAGDDCYCGSKVNIPVEIKCEDATIETTWNPLFKCTNTVTLTAKITEAQDGYPGDITKAGPMVFDIVDFWERPVASYTSPVNTLEPGVGEASVTATLAEGVYYVSVHPQSDCYYCAAAVDQCAVVFCDGFVTGGGWITCPDGERKNFGFNVKYKKSGNVPQGSLQFVDHGTKLNFHSTNMYGVVVYPHPEYPSDPKKGIAVFWGKGSIKGQGAFNFTAEVWDSGEPGTADKFSIRLTPVDSNVLTLTCPDADYCPINSDGTYYIAPCVLSGGNIQLHAK